MSIFAPIRTQGAPAAPSAPALSAPLRVVTIAVLSVPWIIPIDYVFVQPAVRIMYATTLAAGAVLFFFLPHRAPERRWTLLAALVAIAASGFAVTFFGATGTVLLLLRVLSGFVMFRLVRNPSLVLAVFVGLDMASLAADYLTESFVYLNFFDGLRFVPNTEVALRPRGFVGHAVPAGILAVVVACSYAVARSHRPRGATHGVVIMAASIVAALLSGTRSALLVFIALAALALLRQLKLRRFSFGRISALILLSSVAAVVVHTIGRDLPIFARGPLENSSSFIVRSNALAVLDRLPNPCGPPCTIAGHGFGSLQEILRQGYGFRYINTVDNQFVSLFWDFGALGLAAVILLAGGALRTVLRESDRGRTAGAFGILGLVLGGFFYDVLWNSLGTLFLGLFIGMWTAPREPLERAADDMPDPHVGAGGE